MILLSFCQQQAKGNPCLGYLLLLTLAVGTSLKIPQ